MKIEVNYKRLASFDDNFASLSRKMDKISDKVNKYASSLDWEVAASDNISGNLAKATKGLQKQSDTLNNMSKFVTKAAKTYKEMDQAEKQSRMDKIKKAISGVVKKVINGFEKVMGFIGSKFMEHWPQLKKDLLDFYNANWFGKAAELVVFLGGNLLKNSKFFMIVSGDIFDRSNLSQFRVGRFLLNKYDQLDNRIKNSKLVRWFSDPSNMNRLKQSIRKIGSNIYKGGKVFLNKVLKSSPLALIIGVKDIATETIEIWKNPNLSTEEKWKQTIVETLYVGGKAITVTAAASLAASLTALVSWPSGPAAVVAAFTASFTAGLATEAVFFKYEVQLREKIYNDVDTLFNASKTIYQHKDAIGDVMTASVMPLTPVSLVARAETANNIVNTIQNKVKPEVMTICTDSVERDYFNHQAAKLEATAIQSANQLSYASEKIQTRQHLEITPPKQITINFKISSYFQAYAQ